jgi:hypothetical protein
MSDAAHLRVDQIGFDQPAGLRRLERNALIVGVLGAVICIIAAIVAPAEQFLRSYLLAFVFWLNLTLGCLGILMLAHVSSAEWAFPIRRILEAAGRNVWWMAVLFVPVLIGLPKLYSWAAPGALQSDKLLRSQHIYLNIPGFIIRTILYFAVWSALAWLLSRWSWTQDSPPERSRMRRFQNLAGAGLLIYGWTMTFASVDWMMSLDHHWRSTIYGFYIIAGQGLNGFAFVIIAAVLLWPYRPLSQVMTHTHLHDISKLMFAFLILWAYQAFSQGLIYWAGNMPSEISWYINRTTGGWWWVGLSLIFLQFFLPFFLLLSQNLKRDPRRIIWVAAFIMLMRWVDLYWLIIPNFPDTRGHLHFSWINIPTTLGIGGLWVFLFLRNLRARPLIARYDPMLVRVLEAAEHGE